MGSEAIRRLFVWAILAGAALLAVLIGLWPGWTLRYMHVLAWPVVALVAVAAFGPALRSRIPSLDTLHLPGGVIATFNEQHVLDLEFAEDVPNAGVDAGELARMTEIARSLGVITGAFQFQLTYLRLLSEAPDGLTVAASIETITSFLDANPSAPDPPQVSVPQLLDWLVTTGATVLSADGNYRITEFGRVVVMTMDTSGLFIAPKSF